DEDRRACDALGHDLLDERTELCELALAAHARGRVAEERRRVLRRSFAAKRELGSFAVDLERVAEEPCGGLVDAYARGWGRRADAAIDRVAREPCHPTRGARGHDGDRRGGNISRKGER